MDDPEAPGARRGKPGTSFRRVVVLVAAPFAAWAVVAACTPGGAGVPSGLGGSKASSPDDDEFVEEFKRAQQLFGGGKDARAEAIFRRLLEKHPDAAAVHHALGWIEWFRGDREKALTSFEEAARYAPEDGAIRRDLGFRYIDLGRDADALPHLEAAKRLLDPDCETLCGIGRALAAAGRNDDAEKVLREALDVDANTVDGRTLLARLVVRRDPEQAADLLKQIPPNWPDVVLVRAQAMERLGRWDEATAASSRAAELAAPGAPGVTMLRDAAESLVRCGGGPRAAEVAKLWSDREAPGGAGAQRAAFCLATARASAGDAASALDALDAIPSPDQLAPQARAHVAVVRAHLLLELGRKEDARAALTAVAALDGKDAAFERELARHVIAGTPSAELAQQAGSDQGRRNDVAWADWLRARFAGDAAAATAARKAALAASDPPGEHPAALLRGVR